MIGDAHDRHDAQHAAQCRDMDRDQEHECGDDYCPGQCLPGVKAHCGPGGGGAAGVVDGVGGAEPEGAVHQAVGPVKPGVVQREIKQDREGDIPKRLRVHVSIDPRPAPVLPSPGEDARWHAVNRGGGERPENLSPDLRFQARIKPGMAHPRGPGEAAARNQITDADDQRHRKCGKTDGSNSRHETTIRDS